MMGILVGLLPIALAVLLVLSVLGPGTTGSVGGRRASRR
jgi:hypothetical protein